MTATREQLAIHGGSPTIDRPLATGKRFGEEELAALKEALEQQTLFYGHGQMVHRACEKMKAYTGMPYVAPCSSGSAAIHLGLIACGIGAGDEVITTPNTDSGTVLGIIAEGAVPVFCDCEWNLQPSARTIAAAVTKRTRAVVVVHLAGYPTPVDEIMAYCQPRGIGVVEDCAQSWGATLHGRMVGSFGDVGAYSTNDYKHISTGDGGFVALRDEALYRRVVNYADKHYDRLWDRSQRQLHQGLNYRMSELQGAVAVAQLDKVDGITGRQNAIGDRLVERLADLPAGCIVRAIEGGKSTYWWTVIFPDLAKLSATRDELVAALQAEGVPASTYNNYDLIHTGLFQQRVVRPWLDDDRRHYPFVQPDGRSYTYDYSATPNHRAMLDAGVRIAVNCYYTDEDVDLIARGVHKVFGAFAR